MVGGLGRFDTCTGASNVKHACPSPSALRGTATCRTVQGAEARRALQLQLTAQKAANATVRELFAIWLADGVARKDGNAELSRSFVKDVLPRIGDTPIMDVTEGDLRNLLRAVVARGVNRMAASLSRDLRQMFSWAEKRQSWRKLLAEGNPAELVEIEKLWAAVSSMDTDLRF